MPRGFPKLFRRRTLLVVISLCLFTNTSDLAPVYAEEDKPNIVIILADDLGYGDLSCLNPESKIPTPRIDELAAAGMVFTDAHTPSSVCTPTRYGLLTGRYCWRTRLKQSVLLGFDRPLIEPGRATIASFLRAHGYATCAIGKWHLGLGWQNAEGKPVTDKDGTTNDPGVDYTKPITEGPLTVGFDYFFGIAASLDMAPYCYIENDRVTAIPTEPTEGQGFPASWRAGMRAKDFRHEEVVDRLAEAAERWLRQHKATRPHQPFFLYYSLTAPHTPVLPLPAFRGKSQAGLYGDFVVQVDATVGRLVDLLRELGYWENTILILTSDNGSTMTIRSEFQKYGHATNYIFRGQKSDIWEGGHRVPFIVTWPAGIPPGTRCDRAICLVDILPTVAEILGRPLPPGAAEDGVSFAPLLRDPDVNWRRPPFVMHSIQGYFAIRDGEWKLIECRGSGGWSLPENKVPKDAPAMQLYHLGRDIRETTNLYPAEHKRAAELLAKLRNIRGDQPVNKQSNE
ncbi:MAG: arylsulfatase [Thermoguttaceae bacterium]|nr:arylsulfatase [Thermoguttaceae bacterium]